MRIGLVGCGRIAERGWLPAIASVEGAQLASVADLDTDRAKQVAPNTPVYASADELVAAGGVDALIIATPPRSHLGGAQAAAAAGLPSLVEKPPAAEVGQARLLAELQPPPWIGFNRRFEPRVQQIRDRLTGTRRLQLSLTFNYRRASWKAHVVAVDPLLDVGTHLLDLARWLTGSELRRIRAEILTDRGFRVGIEFGRGVALVSSTNDRPYYEGLEVRDGDGSRVAAFSRGGLVNAVRARFGSLGADLLVESLMGELAAFCRAVNGGAAGSLATAADGLAAMTAVDGARHSADEGGTWVDVSPKPRPD